MKITSRYLRMITLRYAGLIFMTLVFLFQLWLLQQYADVMRRTPATWTKGTPIQVR